MSEERLQKWGHEIPLIVVIAAVAAGVALAMAKHWRVGLVLCGIGLLVGAALRAVLRDDRIGMLAVRGRLFDVLTLGVLGGTLIVLAQSLSTTA